MPSWWNNMFSSLILFNLCQKNSLIIWRSQLLDDFGSSTTLAEMWTTVTTTLFYSLIFYWTILLKFSTIRLIEQMDDNVSNVTFSLNNWIICTRCCIVKEIIFTNVINYFYIIKCGMNSGIYSAICILLKIFKKLHNLRDIHITISTSTGFLLLWTVNLPMQGRSMN